MLKKTLLCGALAFAAFTPWVIYANTPNTSEVKQNLSDTAITAQIKALYLVSPLIKSFDITVVTNDHDVVLSGIVDTDMQYEEAVTLAQSVDGVTDVTADKLTVTASKAPMKDTYITAKAKGTIMKEKLFGSKEVQYWPITIETKDGVVYLAGTVDTAEQSANIVKLVKGIQGVTSVKSVIKIK